LDDWFGAVSSRWFGKYEAAPQRSWMVIDNGSGNIGFFWTEDGSTSNQVFSSVPLPVASNDRVEGRVTFDVNDGGGNYLMRFWYRFPGETAWTQLGTDRTGPATTIFSGTSPFYIGGSDSTNLMASGKVYRAQVWDGIEEDGGTLVLDADFTNKGAYVEEDLTKLLEGANGATVTINRSASGYRSVIVSDRSVYAFATDDYMEADDAPGLNFDEVDDFTVMTVARIYANATAFGRLMNKQDATGPGYTLAPNNTTVQARFFIEGGVGTAADNDATADVTGLLVTFSGRRDRTGGPNVEAFSGTNTDGATADATTGSLSNTQTLRIGSQSASVTDTQDMEFVGGALFRKALTDEEIVQVVDYYQQTVTGAAVTSFSSAFSSAFGF
jgi:hypothetical protein